MIIVFSNAKVFDGDPDIGDPRHVVVEGVASAR
jgi:hypothetical protein